ncbi:hypothetical protein IKF20_01835 [Candidatus Saccharibacteria bacterium]|nr:hypothetical protein [Candidatus Saccharibacteria bacterium]
MKTINRYKLDKNSLAVKFLRKNKFFADAFEGDIEGCNFVADAKKLGVPLSDYVMKFCSDTTRDEKEMTNSTVAVFALISFKEWCNYQQTFVLSDEMLEDAVDRMPADDLKDLKLPFPAILVIMELKKEKTSIGFLISQRENGDFDVTMIKHDALIYFPLNDQTIDQIAKRQLGDFFADELGMVTAAYTLFLVAFLSVYRQERKVVKVNRVVRRGRVDSKRLQASEWRFDDSVVLEKLPDAKTSLRAAFNLDDLIPPSERKEEVIVEAEHTHASPRRHHVRTHTCVYWTGKGRKIPVVRTIQSYERGGKKTDHAMGAKRICKPD